MKREWNRKSTVTESHGWYVCVSECECAITAWLLCVASCINDPVGRMCEWDCMCVEESGACIDGLSFLWTCTVFFFFSSVVCSFVCCSLFFRLFLPHTCPFHTQHHNHVCMFVANISYRWHALFDNYFFIEWLAYHFIWKEISATIIHINLTNILFSLIEIYEM